MKFNIITTSFNSEKTILKSFKSIENQSIDKKNINWLVIDGKSTDKTTDLIKKINSKIKTKLISEKDNGLYYAYNKGIKMLKYSDNETIINFLDSDNEFFFNDALEIISSVFEKYNVDIVFTDLIYVNNQNKIIRYWSSKPSKSFDEKFKNIEIYKKFKLDDHLSGWSIPLPTLFIKKSFIDKVGNFNTNYSICSDYEWSLRVSSQELIKAAYIPSVFVKMRLGGVSNKLRNLFKIKIQDFSIIYRFYKKRYFVFFFSIFTLVFKNLRKIPQFLKK